MLNLFKVVEPDVLVFDEATSSLDSESEKLIQQAMRSILGTRTTIIIAETIFRVNGTILFFLNYSLNYNGSMVTQLTDPPSAGEIEAIFDRIAPVYDSLNQWLSLGQHQIWKLMSVKWSQPQVGDTALDICCGSGDLTQMLAHRVGPTGKVYGLDFSAEQLAVARKKTPLQPIEWIEGDALELPFPSRTFDCLTMSYGLRNLTDIPKALMEVHRVLKEGARAAILDFHRPSDAVMSLFQDLYLTHLVVPVAEYYGLKEDYAYISASLERFPNGTEQVKLGYQAGFSDVVHYPIAGGMMGVLVLTK